MTATFKVVEFYRNKQINANNTNNNENNNSIINDESSIVLSNQSLLNADKIPVGLVASFNSIYASLGFNVVGGYSTDIPATIIDIADDPNGKLIKVEEGDIILEINGISTRHLTLSEIYKQLKCCGNRVLLKLKSDPDFKLNLKEQILKNQDKIFPELLVKTSPTKESFISRTTSGLRRTDSQSCDTNSSLVTSTDNAIQQADSHNLISTNSSTSSNISSINNSQSNILDAHLIQAEPTSQQQGPNLITDSFNKLALQSLAYNDQRRKAAELDKNTTLTREKVSDEANQQTAREALSSPSSSSSLPTNINELYSSESSSSTASSTIVNNKDLGDSQASAITASIDTQSTELNTQPADTIDGLVSRPELSVEMISQNGPNTTPVLTFSSDIDDNIKKKIDEKLKECSDSDSESEFNVYQPKAVDLPSVQRLAKRLYYLDGFKANDVVRHLSKKNDFNQLVADEYLKLFNFQSLTLDCALRKFLKQFQLVGDAQEKERVLMYFAKRYVDANNTTFQDVDSCHTLTCAIMLLNTDLHDSKIQSKMTLTEFVENLKGLNNGSNFSDALLESLYSAIKSEPLECASLENEDISDIAGGMVNGSCNLTMRPIGSNPFLQIPDPQTATEYKFGWLLRKCCIDSDGKRSPFLKRSWKMFYASLRDMVLYLHKDDKVFKNNSFDNITNAIRIHHAYATVATDYKKKQFVFRLKTADWAEYLFQTSNSSELYDWVGTINSIAAMFSSPPLPGGIGSSKTFQRPLLPVSKTRYTLQEQFEYHKKHIKQLQGDLSKLEQSTNGASHLHIKDSEKSFFDKDKYNYLQFEIQRYTVYANILEEKIIADANIAMANNPTMALNEQTNSLNNHEFHSLLPLNQNNHMPPPSHPFQLSNGSLPTKYAI